MASTTDTSIDDDGWSEIASGAAESLLTSDGNGFFWVIRASKPASSLTIGHVVDGYTNEPVVTKAGETLYVRSRSGAVTLVATVDAE